MKISEDVVRLLSRTRGLLFVLLVLCPMLQLRAQEEGSSCLTPQVISDTSTPISISGAGEHWFKISLDLLPMGVFYESDVSGEVLRAEVDFHCDGIPYSDHTLEAAVKMIEKDNGVTLPFSVKFDETTRGGKHGYELLISNKYKTLLMAYGILYEVYAYVKITIPEAVAPDPGEEQPAIEIIPEEELVDCREDAEYIRVGDVVNIATNDQSTVHILPLNTWRADTVELGWGGNRALHVYIGDNCGFTPDVNSTDGMIYHTFVPVARDTFLTPDQMAALVTAAGTDEVFAKFVTSGIPEQLLTKRPVHSVAVDRDGLSKATAFEFDWINGNEQPAGEYWYHLSLDTLYEYDGPDMAYHIVNLSDQSFTVHLRAQAAGEEESKDITLSPGQDWYRHENAGTLVRMNVHDIYYIINSEQPVRTYAQVSESGASDAGCLEALAFNWEDGNDQAANQSKWYAIDMREVMRSATRKDVEVNIVNKSDVVNPASIDISLNCPSTGVTTYSTNLAAKDTLTRTLGSGMLKSIADSVVYVHLTAEQAVHVFAKAIDAEAPPLWDNCGDAYRLLVDGEYTYPYTHITMVAGVRDTADLGDTLLYKIKVEDLRGKKMLPEVTVTNLGASAVTIYGEVSFECPAYSVQKQSVTLGAGASNVGQIDKSMVDGVSAEYIYVRMWAEQPFAFSARLKSANEGTACLTAREFEWKKDLLQNPEEAGTASTFWYAIDLYEAKQTHSDIRVRITNRSGVSIPVKADLAFDCPYADLMSQTRTVGAGESMERVIDYSTFAMLGSAQIYAAVTAAQNVTLYGELVPREHVEPDSACLHAVPYDWANGMRIQSDEPKDTLWLAVDMDSLRNTSLLPKIIVTNHCNKNIAFDGMFIVECPDSIGGQKQSFTLKGDSTYVRTMSRDMLKQLDPNIETGYIRIIATGLCIDYSFRVEMIQPDAGVSCAMPISFNWLSGHDQEADKTLWYEIDLTEAKAGKKDINLLIKNKTATACSLELAYAPECPCEQPQTALLSLAANGQNTRTIPYSMYETMGSRIWIRLTSCTAVHFEASMDEPAPFDAIECPDDAHKVNLTFNTEYTYPVAGTVSGDTVFYVITGEVLDTLRQNEKLSIRSHIAVGDCGAQTVTGMIYYHCPIDAQPMKQTVSLSAGQDSYKLIERSMIDQMLTHDSVIVMLVSPKCFTFEAELYDPNSGQDCQHAIREDMGCTIQEAGETKWYRYDVSALSKLDTMLTVEVVNLSETLSDVVSVTAYPSCGGEELLSRKTTIAPGDTVRKEIPADMLLGVSSEYAFLQITSSQQTKVCLNGKEYEPFGPIYVTDEVEVVPNIALVDQQPDSVWYTLNIGALLADTCWQEVNVRVRNTDTHAAHLYGELAWSYEITHAMTSRRMTIAVGDTLQRTLTRADLDGMRDKTPFVRLTSDAKVEILVSADLCEVGETCTDPIAIDWQYGNLHQSDEARWYAVELIADSIVAHASDALVINFANVATEQTVVYADLYNNCIERDPFEHLQDTLAAGESRTRVLYNCATQQLFNGGYVVFCYRSKLTTRINFAWVPAVLTDSIYDYQVIDFAEEPSYEWRGQSLTMPGVYFDTIPYINPLFASCDSSRYMIQLIASVTEKDTICGDEEYIWHNKSLDTTGVYYDTIPFVESQYLGLTTDSAYYEMHFKRYLVEKDSLLDTTVHVLSLPFVWRGRNFIRDTTGCEEKIYYPNTQCIDSLFTLNLTIENGPKKYDTLSFCQSDTLFWRNDTILVSGSYADTLRSVGGIDSVFYYLEATRLDTLSASVETHTICGEDSLLWRGKYYKNVGTYRDTTYYPTGCDSVYYTLNLNVLVVKDTVETDSICPPANGIYRWNDKDWTIPTNDMVTKTYTFNDVKQYPGTTCDSMRYEMQVTVFRPLLVHNLDTTICQADVTGFKWKPNDREYAGFSVSTMIYDTVQAKLKPYCDSIISQLKLTVQKPIEDTIVTKAVICYDDEYEWLGTKYSVAGRYDTTLLYAKTGCDSAYYRLELAVRERPDTVWESSNLRVCEGKHIEWNGQWIGESGVYVNTVKYPGTDCDSVYHAVRLDVLTAEYADTLEVRICPSDSYTWRNGTYTEAGFYNDTLRYDIPDACDSIIYTLHLTVLEPQIMPLETAYICSGEKYTWHGVDYTTTGTYQHVVRSAVLECDSIIYNLQLEKQAPMSKVTDELYICGTGSVEWDLNGRQYSVPGVYYDTLQNMNGCDSIAGELRVVVQQTTIADMETATIYESETYTWRGKTYDEAGTYGDTIKFVSGACDSIVYSLMLTVLPIGETVVDITDVVCPGATYEGHQISAHTIWSDTALIRDASGALVNQVTNYDIDVYEYSLPAGFLLNGGVGVHCGSPIVNAKAVDLLNAHTSNPMFAPIVSIEWQIQQIAGTTVGPWETIDPDMVLNGMTTEVNVLCVVTTECGELRDMASFVVDSTAAYINETYDYLPVVVLYGGNMLMVDKDDVLSNPNYKWEQNPTDRDVVWYQVVGQMDDLNDPNGERDDLAVAWGWYFTPNPAQGTKPVYYALIKHIESQGMAKPCSVYARTVSVEHGSNVTLSPSVAANRTQVSITGGGTYMITVQTASSAPVWSSSTATNTFMADFGAGTYIVTATDIASGVVLHFTLMLY